MNEGIKLVRENNIKFILPIGGGSVIDTAKCIAVNYNNYDSIKEYNLHKKVPTEALPIGAILSISAASQCPGLRILHCCA